MNAVRTWGAWIGLIALCACGTPTQPTAPTPLSVTLDREVWETFAVPLRFPLENEGSALAFDFPTEDIGSIHYMFTKSPELTLRGTLVMTVQMTTTGAPQFGLVDPGPCGIPPTVRPFFWSHGGSLDDYDRWWANPHAVNLTTGVTTLEVPLKGEHWSSVNGQTGNSTPPIQFKFETALLNVSRLGLTFGGGCSFGHGVFVKNGTARFRLTQYAIR